MSTESTPIEIDGSVLEGGGQIIRISLALSAITHTPIRISKIRSGRDRPGLMEQHLKGAELITKLTGASARGLKKGSTTVEFTPRSIKGGNYTAPVKTAGSIALLLQVSLPVALFARDAVSLVLEGGTNAEMAPQIDYVTEVFKPNLNKLGAGFTFDLIRRGYYPQGGGRVEVGVTPVDELRPIVLEEFGDITAVYGWSFIAGRMHVTETEAMASGARAKFEEFGFKNVDIECYQETHEIAPVGDCAGIVVIAETSTGCVLGASALKKRNENASDVGKRAAEELANALTRQVCVDSHCQDQLIIFMALANGTSRIKTTPITMHTKTAIYIAEKLTTAKFTIESNNNHCIIECKGVGHTRRK